ncbi:MAG: indole-3-glycerol phosphate synthase TrpC [Bacteroidetes bacterium]|nr:indole-3-glycerol phosphate synthase TrpC [Bacteroidota bacterium]
MTILEKIIAHKRKEVKERIELFPTKLLEQSIYFETPVVSLKKYLLREDKSGIIAEFKRQSPSKGAINPYASVEQVTIGYMQAGASALSILTDTHFFDGKNEDLTEARRHNFCPILRKDFVIDEYQIIEARSIGADAILLIAECLEKAEVRELAKKAKSLGLEILLEVHSQDQLDKLCDEIDIVGVNNRNLSDFKVSIATSLELADDIPQELVKISESGISKPNSIVELKQAGYQGFLIGEYFMKTAQPAKTCSVLIQRVEYIEDMLKNAIA